jgi:hypothetical protein
MTSSNRVNDGIQLLLMPALSLKTWKFREEMQNHRGDKYLRFKQFLNETIKLLVFG